ncbi:MAG: DDE-type integrase/transposase/recombinase, partial [Planctomycetes bacterium]|nr:DDE-type integrase/transposase/recombinase [Planctomycetota bacterium]
MTIDFTKKRLHNSKGNKEGYYTLWLSLADLCNKAAKRTKRFKVTTNSQHKYPVASNLLNRQFDVDCPNKVWASDITYLWTKEGWLYLATIMDLYSRKIVGWSVSNRINADLSLGALKMALGNRRPEF